MVGGPRVFSRRGRVLPPYNPALERYYHQRRTLFTRYDKGVRLDAEGWFSVTPEAAAATTARLLAQGAPGRTRGGRLTVDAFAGVGGNAIQLARSDPTGVVIAVDIDPDKVAMARHNASLYGVAHRIEFVVGDFLAIARGLRAHVRNQSIRTSRPPRAPNARALSGVLPFATVGRARVRQQRPRC